VAPLLPNCAARAMKRVLKRGGKMHRPFVMCKRGRRRGQSYINGGGREGKGPWEDEGRMPLLGLFAQSHTRAKKSNNIHNNPRSFHTHTQNPKKI
jgi:hypothetical protein